LLFKYLPIERIDVIQNLKIRFTPLISLNDPFEALPLVDLSDVESELMLSIEKDAEELWNSAAKHEQTKENKLLLEEQKSILLNSVKENVAPEVAGKELMSLLDEKFCILSLSRTEKSLLMWSHYASSNTGYVIEFDESHDFFRQKDMEGSITKPIPVIYSEKRFKRSSNEHDYYQKMFCSKPLEWAYEEEERLFRTFLSMDSAIGTDEHGKNINLLNIPKDCILGVYIGYKASKKTEEKIIAAVNRHDIDCKIYKSGIHSTEYKMIFREITK